MFPVRYELNVYIPFTESQPINSYSYLYLIQLYGDCLIFYLYND
jgi:hypothetical protein